MENKIGIDRKIGRKIVVMLIAFTMLFSVALFSGCTNDNSELLNELAQLRELLEEKSVLSQQLQELTELVNGMKGDNEELEELLTGKLYDLQNDIVALYGRLKGLEANNGDLLEQVGKLQEQVEELREKLEAMKNSEEGIPFRVLLTIQSQLFLPLLGTAIVTSLEEWRAIHGHARRLVPETFIERSLANGNSIVVAKWFMGNSDVNFIEKISLTSKNSTLTIEIFVWDGISNAPIGGLLILEICNTELVGIDNVAVELNRVDLF